MLNEPVDGSVPAFDTLIRSPIFSNDMQILYSAGSPTRAPAT